MSKGRLSVDGGPPFTRFWRMKLLLSGIEAGATILLAKFLEVQCVFTNSCLGSLILNLVDVSEDCLDLSLHFCDDLFHDVLYFLVVYDFPVAKIAKFFGVHYLDSPLERALIVSRKVFSFSSKKAILALR